MKTITKTIAVIVLGSGLCVTPLMAGVSPTDQKWAKQVEKLAAKGPVTVSTTQSSRLDLAQQLAKRNGWQCKVQQVGKTWRIQIIPKAGASKVASR